MSGKQQKRLRRLVREHAPDLPERVEGDQVHRKLRQNPNWKPGDPPDQRFIDCERRQRRLGASQRGVLQQLKREHKRRGAGCDAQGRAEHRRARRGARR